MQTQYDIFISYSDKDRELARKVYDALKAEGFNCWIAFNDIPHGEVWAEAITKGIIESKTFLLILTPNSNNSRQVLREVEYADKQDKKLYCYKAEDLVASRSLDFFISSIQQFEAYNIAFEKAIKRMFFEFKSYLGIKKPIIQAPIVNDKAQEYFEKGDKLFEQGKYGEAYIPLLQAADLGHSSAQNKIGSMYEKELGVKQDYRQAMQWYVKASDQGHGEAQINIGGLYWEGLGVKQDYRQSMQWYLKAIENGEFLAQLLIGKLYLYGFGVKKDYNQAIQWFLKAAENGITNAMRDIGYMFKKGLGVKQDYKQATLWYIKAYDNGDIGAKYSIKEFGREGEETALNWLKDNYL